MSEQLQAKGHWRSFISRATSHKTNKQPGQTKQTLQ